MENRTKRRVPCQLRNAEGSYTGMVLDLSPSGLFVQTTAQTELRQRLSLQLQTERGKSVELEVEVARQKHVPARLKAIEKAGVGVRISNAPERYFQFLQEIAARGAEDAVASDSDAQGAAAAPRFRIRVREVAGCRSRRIEVEAESLDVARERALARVGRGWKILTVDDD
ncbi:MAG: PilZ domain-containing protein [Myxococcota bacterium]